MAAHFLDCCDARVYVEVMQLTEILHVAENTVSSHSSLVRVLRYRIALLFEVGT